MATYVLEKRPEWQWCVTPKPMDEKPVHRWCVFPHSFSPELVHALIDEWRLRRHDHILDPFAGAGTTILAAKEKGIPATGYDLSPLAVLVGRVKTANYSVPRLKEASRKLNIKLQPARWNGVSRAYPQLVEKALPGKLLGAFEAIKAEIDRLPYSSAERDFFRLSLLTTLPKYSRAIATGGWLKWVRKRTDLKNLPSDLKASVQAMIGDVGETSLPRRAKWHVGLCDARALPDADSTYSAVITSPPYPNRHDYTRVFGVELMFGFLDWKGTRALRYQSIHSHPESRPNRPDKNGYAQPSRLSRVAARVRKSTKDERVPLMLEGYFLDIYLCLREVARVCREGANIAIVVGNVQYGGEPVLVDELVGEIGEQAGLTFKKLIVARYRGNSAQQMGLFGRNPSRESVVVFEK